MRSREHTRTMNEVLEKPEENFWLLKRKPIYSIQENNTDCVITFWELARVVEEHVTEEEHIDVVSMDEEMLNVLAPPTTPVCGVKALEVKAKAQPPLRAQGRIYLLGTRRLLRRVHQEV